MIRSIKPIRNLRATALAMFALLALGAIGAQSASAAVEHSFTSNSNNERTVLTGTTEPGTKEIFTLTQAKVECEDVSYRGTVVGNNVDHVSVVPIFTNATCTSPAGAATIHNNGCTYTFDSDTNENTTHFAAGQLHANVSVVCGHTGSITIESGGCDITVEDTHTVATPPSGHHFVTVNQNLPGIRYTPVANHSGGKSAMTVEATARTIKATTKTANCALLGLGNPGTHSNGTFAGKAIVTGYEDTETPDTIDPHSSTAPGEGALVDLGLTTP